MNKKNIILAVLILIICLILFTFYINNKSSNKEVNEVKIVDNIEKYGYTLYDNKSSLYKEKFSELKEILNKEDFNEKEYAEKIAELFTIDFYDLNSKKTNTDIGGIDFIHKNAKDEFILAAKDTLYKYIESDVYGGRNQKLPEITTVVVSSIENVSFKSDKLSDEKSYEIKVDITYKEDLEYPTSVTLTLIHDENKLYIVEVK